LKRKPVYYDAEERKPVRKEDRDLTRNVKSKSKI